MLLGRSPRPEPEGTDTASTGDRTELRRILMARMQAQGDTPDVRAVEDALRRLLANREIQATLDAINLAGARAEYFSCDVLNPEAFAALLNQLENGLGPVTAVIHGAGIIEDRYIIDKHAASFDRVVQTKIRPLLTLADALDLSRLKLLVLFSSVAGFFGNPGQCDYAAANEMLNRIARRLREQLPAKVFALNWGPWTGAGMVTPEVARQFQARGVGMMTVPAGRRAAWREILATPAPDVRILLGSGSWTRILPGSLPTRAPYPLLTTGRVYRLPDGAVLAQLVLDENLHPFLRDHRIGSNPVVPLAVAMELMAEVALTVSPGWHLARVEGLRLFKGVIIEAGYREVIVLADPPQDKGDTREVRVRIQDPARNTRPFYQARVILSERKPVPPCLSEMEEISTSFPLPMAQAYRRWLFHGPAFQAISVVESMDSKNANALVHANAAVVEAMVEGHEGWVLNPFVIDTAPQLAILWSRRNYDTTPLPNGITRCYCYGRLDETPMQLLLRTQAGSGAEFYRADVWFVRDGKVIAKLEGLEGAGSSELNQSSSCSIEIATCSVETEGGRGPDHSPAEELFVKAS